VHLARVMTLSVCPFFFDKTGGAEAPTGILLKEKRQKRVQSKKREKGETQYNAGNLDLF